MTKKRFILASVLIAMLIVSFTGCDQLTGKDDGNGGGDNTGGGGDDGSGVSFENFTTKSVLVKNNTGEKLVAFKGEISPSALISGVPAHASNHGLKKDEQLFSATGDFALIFITEEQYIANKSNLAALENAAFARVYAFYNASESFESANVYEISSRSGGSAKLVLNNSSAFNVEIRMNSPTGIVLGYVPADTVNTVLNVEPGDYTLFPIFKKYISRDNEIYSIKPVFKKGVAIGKPYSRDIGIIGTKTWDVGTVYDSTQFGLSAGGFYITINNQTGADILFSQGDTAYETSSGLTLIGSGNQQQYFVPFNRDADGQYPASFTFGQLKIGSTRFPQLIPSQAFENNKKYTIDVTGADASDITLGDVVDAGVVDIDQLFGL